jgi:radical SAM superfamily enzyme YgiQ (UPF0313 family)
MRVLLVSPNREQLPDPVFPLGLSYIAAALKKHGHELRVADLCFSEDTDREIRNAVAAFDPEVIGISLRNIDDVAWPKRHSHLNEYREVVESVRKYTTAPVVLGGSGFTIMPGRFMEYLRADYGIAGEGEKAFPELISRLEAVKGGKKPSLKIPGVIRPRARLRELDAVVPDRTCFDIAAYYRFGGMLNIQTKRGCPFRCIYCTYPVIDGKRVRMRSPASVADEVSGLTEKTGVSHFFFTDSIFNYPVSHAEAVCREIIKRRVNIRWSCYLNPAYMTGRLAELMLKAGCTGVEFGTDSLVDKTLMLMGKNFTFAQIKKASALCRRHGLRFCHFLFAGGPGDDNETVRTNLGRLDDINPDAAVIMAGIRIYPNTRLSEMAAADLGIRDIGLDPVFYLSKNIADIDSIAQEVSKRRRWVMPGYEINIYPRLQRKLREQGIKGSLWEELSKR